MTSSRRITKKSQAKLKRSAERAASKLIAIALTLEDNARVMRDVAQSMLQGDWDEVARKVGERVKNHPEWWPERLQ